MKEIWKYELKPDSNDIKMPEGAQVLTVQAQHGVPILWALVDTTKPSVIRRFVVVCTGQPFTADGCGYIATFQLDEGGLVLHVFEVL